MMVFKKRPRGGVRGLGSLSAIRRSLDRATNLERQIRLHDVGIAGLNVLVVCRAVLACPGANVLTKT